jgi:8-amino-7-oxononanoate synthase
MQRPDLLERLSLRHAERAQRALARRLRTVQHAEGCTIEIDGRHLINFASNDYLGLAAHPAVRAALIDAAQRWGVGATAAHLLGGHRAEHQALEEALADWTGRERALVFSTGYMANLGVLGALLEAGDVCVQDKLNHACLIDGARYAGAELVRYVHGDVDSAARQLAARAHAGALLATDGVFSMDGDVAPLAVLADLCTAQSACLHVDDAHGLGVRGPHGSGSVREAHLGANAVPVYMATLGKALGCFGAFVAGDARLIDALVQFARTHVFTTALPPALAAATRAAVAVARHEDWRRDKLGQLIAHFRAGARQRGFALCNSPTPIQPILLGDSARALAAATELEQRGFYVPAIRPPTVPEGGARLRVTLSALHAEREVEALLDALVAVLGQTVPQPTPAPRSARQAAQPAARTRRARPR